LSEFVGGSGEIAGELASVNEDKKTDQALLQALSIGIDWRTERKERDQRRINFPIFAISRILND
jgi:hypothetical protein